MRALVFGVEPEPWSPPAEATALLSNLAVTPVALHEVADARPLRPDWVVTRPRLTGICGSDSKQILLDFGEGDSDSAMSGFCSFPQVMGHEVVADVVELGPEAAGLEVGDRVVLNPWLSCLPRGIEPVCPACEVGDLSLCWSFTSGEISKGIHTGVSSDATGGYAELMPAHTSMLFRVPDELPDEAAIFADPFAVSLHSITRTPPPAGGRVVIWGAGTLGLCALAIVRLLHPDATVAVVARFPAQADLARKLGADLVVDHEPAAAVLDELAAWSGGVLRPTMEGLPGLPMCHPGFVDVVYDTVARPETLEIGARLLRARGSLVMSGVHAPGRWEWSPLYFKELRLVGSNAFGMEEVDGVRKHGIEHYLELASGASIDLRPLLTHVFPLTAWRDAFAALADQATSGAVKVAIDPQR